MSLLGVASRKLAAPKLIEGHDMGMSSHQSAVAGTTTWLTPPHIIAAVGGWESFDLDPCAAPSPRPWNTALRMNALEDGDGLGMDWYGRVWCNPPYSTAEVAAWVARLADHNHGTALVFARTETENFQRSIWERASGLLFIEGRLHFHYPDGSRAKMNGGAPSVLCAYGAEDLDRLAAAKLPGAFVPLRFARMFAVAGLSGSWSEVMVDWLRQQRGTVSVSDAYRFFAAHPKARGPNWRAKVRQVLRRVGRRVDFNQYEAAA